MEVAISDGIAGENILNDNAHYCQGKRHFPHLNNKTSSTQTKTTVRRFMPHGSGEDYNIYQSRMRYPATSDTKTEVNCPLLMISTNPELSDQHTCQNGSEEVIVPTDDDEDRADANFAIPKYLSDRRNNFPLSTPGDKSYHAVEYSPDFFKMGATVPAVNFGHESKNSFEISNIQLSSVVNKCKTFAELESKRQKELEVAEVEKLDQWCPASPLVNPGFFGPISSGSSPSRRRKV